KLHQPDLAFDDQIGTADIEVIAAAAGEVLELPAGSVVAEIKLEPHALQSIEQGPVHVPRLFGEEDVALSCQWERDGGRDQVAVLQRRSFAVQRVWQLRARLDIDDHGGAALNEGDLCPARVQVLCNVMAAGAGADDKGL